MENQKSIDSSSHGGDGGEAFKCKVKLMCSYGGKIQPRQRDNQLAYVGGDTKILAVNRKIKFSEIFSKLSALCNCGGNGEICIKYQLPGEDLDALVSLIDDDDVEHMMVEYDRMHKGSAKPPGRLRLFLFNPNRPVKSESDPPLNPDFLFGFDKDYQPSITPTPSTHDLLQLHIPVMSVPENLGQETQKENSALPGNFGLGHVTGSVVYANGMKMVYGLPVMAGGYHTGVAQFGGVVAGGDKIRREQPVYNFVPAMPPVPEQKPVLVCTGEVPNYSINGDHPSA